MGKIVLGCFFIMLGAIIFQLLEIPCTLNAFVGAACWVVGGGCIALAFKSA